MVAMDAYGTSTTKHREVYVVNGNSIQVADYGTHPDKGDFVNFTGETSGTKWTWTLTCPAVKPVYKLSYDYSVTADGLWLFGTDGGVKVVAKLQKK
jgi:hypothetical protein